MDMQRMMPLAALLLVLANGAFGQTVVKASPEQESALRERVAKFWDGFVAGKYRQSDNYVSESAKEEFFSWPKKKIRGYKIEQINFTADAKSAQVVTFVDTTLAMMGVGSMDIKQPIETWWQLEEEGWFWFQPQNYVRETPFGKMETNAQSGETPLIPIGPMSQAPSLEEIMAMVKPDRQEVNFVLGEGKEERVVFFNKMQGTVTLTIDSPPAEDISFNLSSREISKGGTAELLVKYQPKGKPEPDAEKVLKIVRVGVAQTGKLYPIQVVLSPPKAP